MTGRPAEAVDKSQLPAFLFRPVPVRKPDPQDCIAHCRPQ